MGSGEKREKFVRTQGFADSCQQSRANLYPTLVYPTRLAQIRSFKIHAFKVQK